MAGEYLSIETSNKIAKLEKENKEMSEIIIKYDKEVNKVYSIIKESIILLNQFKNDLIEYSKMGINYQSVPVGAVGVRINSLLEKMEEIK